MDAPPNPGVSGPDVLDGWKDIASYLGRSPRSVQRWERDLGLPVHRIPTPDGGTIVYALRSEVDAWRSRRGEGVRTALAPGAPAPSPPLEQGPPGSAGALETTPVPAPPPLPLGRLRRFLSMPVPAWTVVAAAGATLAAILMARSAFPRGGVPATWEFEGRELQTYSEGGRPLWAHTFDRAVSRPNTFLRPFDGARADLNGDGRPEILVAVRFSEPRRTTGQSDAVMAFDADGRIVWSVQPDLRFAAGDEVFEGPWWVSDVVTGPTAGGARTWIAFAHHTWWPGFVLEVAPDGTSQLRYVQGGRIYSLTYWTTSQGPRLAVGGTLREPEPGQASAVFLDVDGPVARWPLEGSAALGCDGCPEAPPNAVLLCPTSDVTRALFRPYGWVVRAKADAVGLEFFINDGFGPGNGTLATVTEDLQVTRLTHSDQYWQVHQELENEGRLTHSAEQCPERTLPIDVRKWTPAAGWSMLSVPPQTLSSPTDTVEQDLALP